VREKLKPLPTAGIAGGFVLLLLVLASCGGGQETVGIVVNSTADTDSRDGVVTLREAISLTAGEIAVADLDSGEADNVRGKPGPDSSDTITFDASVFSAPEGGTISLAAPLPPLSGGFDIVDGSEASVLIDGGKQTFECVVIDSSENIIRGIQIQNCLVGVMIQPGAQGNVIGGPAAGEGNVISANDQGIVIGGAGADNNVVKGNLIGVDASGGEALANRNGVDIQREALGNIIGGSEPGDRNIISGNRGVGVTIRGRANVVKGNYIGTDSTGTAAIPNGMEGIWIAPGGEDNIVGGSTAAERNVISGNDLFAVGISGPDISGNVVKGNYLGVDATGATALRNTYGLVLSDGPQDNVIGGDAPGEGNVISGNGTGMLIRGPDTSGNVIAGNYIGTDDSGSQELPNGRGIWIVKGAHANRIGGTEPGEGNLISGNYLAGVNVDGPACVGNTIRGNSIHHNQLKGIYNEEGGNRELEPPAISSINPVAGTACPNCTVDIYSDSQDEGELYEGSTIADAEGNFTFEGKPAGPNATATATDSDGSTSEFSRPALGAASQ
jgi:CSLREA domain-containing protein